ncbi:Aldehyde/histidinol dehydrogenase [Aspergillus crustosus]
MMFIWKIAPALVTGNTVVIKSAEATPLSALKVCELIAEAGFPAGTVNLVSGYGKTVGSAIAHHMDVDKVAFTGSTATGRAIMRAAADSNLKKVTLELEHHLPRCRPRPSRRMVRLGNKHELRPDLPPGTRVYVHEDIYDEFLARFTKTMSELTVGHPFNKETTQGPQNNQMQYDKILGYIESGIEEGATLHLGGKGVNKGTGGYYIQPTIFTDVTPEMKIMREEIFGPVVCISKFTSEAAVLHEANNTNYGLAAAVFTKDYERAIRVTNALKAGTTWVNLYNLVHWSMPFGGFKESGIGRECGEAVLENYTHTKAVYFNMGMQAPRP